MNWFHKSAALHNFKYQLPTNKEQLLYDFYMMSFLPKSDSNVGMLFSEIQDTLTTTLKQKMLDDVFFIITCETRHIFDEGDAVLDQPKEHLKPDEYKVIAHYEQELAFEQENMANRNDPGKGRNPDYDASHRATQSTLASAKMNREQFVNLAKKLFESMDWAEDYGGDAWAQICDAWIHLNKTQKYGETVAYIDHLIDLEHNTGTMFNKIVEWSKNGDYKWIKTVLDHKRHIKSPYELLPYCSPPMQFIATRLLKEKNKTTVQGQMPEAAQNWAELVLQNPEMISRLPASAYAYLSPETMEQMVTKSIQQGMHIIDRMPRALLQKVPAAKIRGAIIDWQARSYMSGLTYMDILTIYFTPQEIAKLWKGDANQRKYPNRKLMEYIAENKPIFIEVITELFEEYDARPPADPSSTYFDYSQSSVRNRLDVLQSFCSLKVARLLGYNVEALAKMPAKMTPAPSAPVQPASPHLYPFPQQPTQKPTVQPNQQVQQKQELVNASKKRKWERIYPE